MWIIATKSKYICSICKCKWIALCVYERNFLMKKIHTFNCKWNHPSVVLWLIYKNFYTNTGVMNEIIVIVITMTLNCLINSYTLHMYNVHIFVYNNTTPKTANKVYHRYDKLSYLRIVTFIARNENCAVQILIINIFNFFFMHNNLNCCVVKLTMNNFSSLYISHPGWPLHQYTEYSYG